MRIFLVRHGQSAGNLDKSLYLGMADHAIPLSPRGIEQAHESGRLLRPHLEGVPRERLRIWTSPYQRTRQTAAAIRAEIDQAADIKEHVLLCEQQFGLFDGLPDDEIEKQFPKEGAHYNKCVRHEGKFWARMPLGESRFDVATRVHQSFGTFHRDRDKHGIDNLVVICHGVTLRAFVMMWCHLTPEWFDDQPNPHNCAIRLIEDGQDRGYLAAGEACD